MAYRSTRTIAEIPADEYRVLLIGDTGSGKTATGNTLLGNRVLTASVYKTDYPIERFNTKLWLYETPGFLNPDKDPSQNFKEIKQVMMLTKPGPHVILMISKIGRFTDERRNIVNELTEVFGENVFKHMVVVFTYSDNLFNPDTEKVMTVEEYIKDSPQDLQILIQKCGYRCVAINNRSIPQKERYAQEIWHTVSCMVKENHGQVYNLSEIKSQLPVGRSQLPNTDMDPPDAYRIVLIGHTEAGKTSSGNMLLGKRVLDDKNNRTEEPIERFGCQLQVYETPGLQNPDIEQFQIYKEIIKTILLTKPGPHAILMVSKIGRFTDEQKQTVDELVQAFGDSVFKYMVVVLTYKDNLFNPDTETEMEIGRYIKESPLGLRRLIERCGYRYIAISNRSRTDREQQARELWNVISTMIQTNNGSYYKHERIQQMYDFHERPNPSISRSKTSGKTKTQSRKEPTKSSAHMDTFPYSEMHDPVTARMEKLENEMEQLKYANEVAMNYTRSNRCVIL